MQIACERIESARSVGLVWLLPAGAAHEPEDRRGISSVVSELLLRGAGSRDSKALADAFDHAGAVRSIAPTVRSMMISATTTGERLEETIALLSDVVFRPIFDVKALEPSKALALQSLASLSDDPQERAFIGARARHLPAPFNRTTYGEAAGIQAIERQDAADWWSGCALPEGSAVGVAGDVDFDALASIFDEKIGSWSGSAAALRPQTTPHRGYAHEEEDSNQCQIVVVHDGPSETDPDADLERLAVSVLSGGMSGRLFTEVREVRALCYAVHAAYRADRDRGVISSYVGTTPDKAQEAIDVLMHELARINSGDVTPEELARAKIGMRSRLVFSGEATSARASALAGDLIRIGRARSLEERQASIERVGLDELNAYLRRRRPGIPTIQTLGPDPISPPEA
ncbi:MAG: pitrilysin family protein [Planctomycetota bacterium]